MLTKHNIALPYIFIPGKWRVQNHCKQTFYHQGRTDATTSVFHLNSSNLLVMKMERGEFSRYISSKTFVNI
jgi:hypothetical protein